MPPLQRIAVFATILALLAAAMARPAGAQEVKVGFVHSDKVLQAYKAYKDAETQFEKQRDAWRTALDERSRKLKSAEEDFKAQQLMLSDVKRKEKLTLLEDQRRELEKYYQDLTGPDGEAARKEEELLRPILEKVNTVIREIGEQEKYSMIFDASQNGLVYAAPALDLTEKVIQRLNSSP
jgi:outer membrane protein